MKKGERKKQQKALKRRAESKLTRKQTRVAGSGPLQFIRQAFNRGGGAKPANPLQFIRQARNYPIEGCWIRRGWDEDGMAVIVIARRQPNGNITFGNYLVDYYCLGLKDTFCNADIPSSQFRRDHLIKMFREGAPLEISPNLAHEIIYGSIEYAAQFGFRPHRDFKLSQNVLDPPDAHPRTGTVKFGKDGQPFYIAGPYDNVDAVMHQLARTAGEGNYHFMMPMGGPPPDDWFDDDSG